MPAASSTGSFLRHFCRLAHHGSQFTRTILGVLLSAMVLFSSLPLRAAAQEAPPLSVDADEVVYDDTAHTVDATGHVAITFRGIQLKADVARVDLGTERVTAHGHVIIITTMGQEIHSDTLTYDARAQVAELSPAEMIVNGVYVHSDHMRAGPDSIVAGASTLTTCDPAHPAYRVTASGIEVIPGDRVTVTGATLWLGQLSTLSLPVMVVSLRSAKETAGSFPSAGYTSTDGLYGAYRFGFFVGAPLAYVRLSLGTLATREDVGLLMDRPVGSLPLSLSLNASTGWHHEWGAITDIATTRAQYTVGATTPDIHLGPQTDWQSSWTWQDLTYGTGAWQGVLRAQSAVTQHLTADNTLTLGYTALRVDCSPGPVPCVPPLAIDKIDPRDLINELRLEYQHSGVKDGVIATTFKTGPFYDFLMHTTWVEIGYGERFPNRYHWLFVPQYNLDTHDVTLVSDTGFALGSDTYFTVQTKYDVTATLFVDLDYILTAQVSGCFELSVEYRQVRQQLLITFGLAALSQALLQPQAERSPARTCNS